MGKTKKSSRKQILLFGFTGGVSTLVDVVIYHVLSYTFNVHYLIANICSFIISIIINYLLCMNFVFQRKENLNKKMEFIIFVILSFIGLLIGEFIIWGLMNYILIYLPIDVISHNKLIAKILSVGVVMIYNFTSRKLILEKK